MGEDTDIDLDSRVIAYRLGQLERKVDAMANASEREQAARRTTNLAIALAVASPIASVLVALLLRGLG